jgi:hypothetical protein
MLAGQLRRLLLFAVIPRNRTVVRPQGDESGEPAEELGGR